MGIFAKDAVGTITHPATMTHMHLVFKDRKSGKTVTGHVEQIGALEGATLRLPKSKLAGRFVAPNVAGCRRSMKGTALNEDQAPPSSSSPGEGSSERRQLKGDIIGVLVGVFSGTLIIAISGRQWFLLFGTIPDQMVALDEGRAHRQLCGPGT